MRDTLSLNNACASSHLSLYLSHVLLQQHTKTLMSIFIHTHVHVYMPGLYCLTRQYGDNMQAKSSRDLQPITRQRTRNCLVDRVGL